jgi:hypothetical protein
MSNLFSTMSRREKILAAIVAGAVFLLFNIVLLNIVAKRQTVLRAGIATKQLEIEAMRALVSERDLWTARDAWLEGKQPPLTNENTAGGQLLDRVKSLAGGDVAVENPAIAAPGKTQHYRSVAVTVETKSLWPALVKFLHALQQPDQCIVLESANIQIDPADATKMKGRFKIAKWYAP